MAAVVTAVVIAGVAVAVLVTRGSGEEGDVFTPSTIGRGTHVCVAVGTPGDDGARFRVPLLRAIRKAHRELATTGSLLVGHGDKKMAAAVRRLVHEGCDLVAATGVEAGKAIIAAARANPDTHFAVLGGTGPVSLPNVTVVRFHPEQAAFLAGYLAAGITRTGIVGAFGGEPDSRVERMLQGFAGGVAKLNADRELAVPLLGWNPVTRRGLFAGSAEDTEAGRRIGQRLVGNGADIVFGVAGNAARGAASVVNGVGDSFMIGSGWDWAQTADAPRNWITSVEERVAVMFRLLVAREVRGKFMPGVVEATLANGGVGLAKFRGPGQSVSPKLRYSLRLIGTQIAEGEVSIDPNDYPPLPSPNAKPTGQPTEPEGED
ncbi:MAG TPA: BMP family ABC transporter substrate-binding protein [Actinomycetota bacterium]|nr:BMP family ABC transporter substrate-binding protein [Actinomycetota bacterium]